MTDTRLHNPQVPAKYKGSVKLRRKDVKLINVRGTKGFVYLEFESANLPRVELEVEDES